MTQVLPESFQISEDEITFLTGGDDPYDDDVVLQKLFHPNLKLLVVSEGPNGCRYYTQVCSVFLKLLLQYLINIWITYACSYICLVGV